MTRLFGSGGVLGICGLALAALACGDDGGSGGSGTTTSGGTTTSDTSSATTTSATTSGSTTSSTSTGDGGGGGAPLDPCEPNEGLTVEASCGIFVDTNAAEGGTGSQAMPFNTLALALAASDDTNNRIYVCGALDEAAVVPGNRRIHGELSCSWVWDFTARTPWTAPSDSIPLSTEAGAADVTVTGFAIEARDAMVPQGSSIAVLVNGGGLDLVRADLAAGTAISGTAGVNGAGGTNGAVGGNATAAAGGSGGMTGCGAGGVGATVSCTTIMGQTICTASEAQPSPGAGGDSFSATCTVGDDGADGADGMAGTDGGLGSIGPTGFIPSDGGNGTAGANGTPGGGGGAKIDSGKHGGGGGAAGCGGGASTGGKGGGSSIAILSLNAAITFDTVTASVGYGGDGGAGGISAPGGTGGTAGIGWCSGLCNMPGLYGCSGGAGGDGGNGGPGGGGSGGHAAIIAYTGIVNSLNGLSATAPMPLQAGQGGGMAPAGQAVVELAFP